MTLGRALEALTTLPTDQLHVLARAIAREIEDRTKTRKML